MISPDSPKTIRIATTPALLSLFKDSEGRNRGPNKELGPKLDPEGFHLVAMRFLHNDVEWRCQWLVKLKGEEAPIPLMMDNGFDAFDKHTQEETVPA